MMEAGIEHGIDPMRLSFRCAVRAVLAFSPALATEPLRKLPLVYRVMFKENVSNLIPERPERNEPRAIGRETKYYPSREITRAPWRLNRQGIGFLSSREEPLNRLYQAGCM